MLIKKNTLRNLSFNFYYTYLVGVWIILVCLAYPKLIEIASHNVFHIFYILLSLVCMGGFYFLWIAWIHMHHRKILKIMFISSNILSLCIGLFIAFIATQHNESETYCTLMKYNKEKQTYIGSRFNEDTKSYVDMEGRPNWITNGKPCKIVFKSLIPIFSIFFTISFVALFSIVLLLGSFSLLITTNRRV